MMDWDKEYKKRGILTDREHIQHLESCLLRGHKQIESLTAENRRLKSKTSAELREGYCRRCAVSDFQDERAGAERAEQSLSDARAAIKAFCDECESYDGRGCVDPECQLKALKQTEESAPDDSLADALSLEHKMGKEVIRYWRLKVNGWLTSNIAKQYINAHEAVEKLLSKSGEQ